MLHILYYTSCVIHGAGCPNLSLIETIDSEKLADRVDKLWVSSERYSGTPLDVMVQINTSNEERELSFHLQDSCLETEAMKSVRLRVV